MKTKHGRLLALFLIGSGSAVFAQDPSLKLQAVLDSVRIAESIQGVSATVIFPDGTTWNGTSGEASVGVALTPETIFEIGSITKTFTATLLVQLVSEGMLAFEDTLARWLPDLPNAGNITLRHLLNHTSGLADHYENPAYLPALMSQPTRRWKAEDSFAFLPDAHFSPGEGWHYSNAGYLALGYVIEQVTGESIGGHFRHRYFEPLSLERTFYAAEEEITGERAHAFIDFNDDGIPNDLTALMPITAMMSSHGTAGALFASASDIARWCRALHTGAILTEAGYEAMTTFVDRPDGNRYGLGVLNTEIDGIMLYGHRGNSVGFSAAVWHAPDLGYTVAVLTNSHGILVTPVVQVLLQSARAFP